MKIIEAQKPFMEYCAVERLNAIETQAKYQDCFNAWIFPLLGDRELESLTRIDILQFRQAMLAKNISVARQYSVLMTLKTFLRFCRAVLKIQTLDPAEIKLPPRARPHVTVLTDPEIEEVLGAIDIHKFSGLRLRAFIEVLLATGMRLSEALSLDRYVFDKDLDRIDIIGKGKKKRTVFFTDRCKTWVKRYLRCRADSCEALFITIGSNPSRWVREDISRFFINLTKRSGIRKKVTPHVLRHTYCTNLLKNGADITYIKDLAGHEDIHTTEKYYLGRDTTALRSVVDRFVKYDLPE